MRALIVSAALLGAAVAQGDPWTDAFTFERVAIPPGIDPQIGGLDTAPSVSRRRVNSQRCITSSVRSSSTSSPRGSCSPSANWDQVPSAGS